MKNLIIDPYAIEDIHNQIDKILRGLGDPDPPLNLEEVRELLELDKNYYSSSNTGALQEYISKLKVGAKQLVKRPSLILDVVRKAQLKSLYLPDRKRILIDETIPNLKERHVEAHEIIHSITPHHSAYLFGDDRETLRHSCYEKLEAEANYGSGQLLFLRDQFALMARDYDLNINTVKKLSSIFGNTITMTLWRVIEELHDDEPMFGAISPHPIHYSGDIDLKNPCRYLIGSPAFKRQFRNITGATVFKKIQSYASGVRGGPLGEGEVLLTGNDNQRYKFHMETFYNRYEALTLGICLGPSRKLVVVR